MINDHRPNGSAEGKRCSELASRPPTGHRWFAMSRDFSSFVSSAAGLYYLAELVEEYTVMTARVIRWISTFTLVAYVGLFLFEDFTAAMVVCGIISQFLNLFLLQVSITNYERLLITNLRLFARGCEYFMARVSRF